MASASGTLTIRMSGMVSSAALTRTAASAIARLVSIEIAFMSFVESTVECRSDQAHRRSPETPGDCKNSVEILPNRPTAQRGGRSLDRSSSAAQSQSSFFPLGLPWFDCHLRILVLPCFRQLLLKHFGIVKPTVKFYLPFVHGMDGVAVNRGAAAIPITTFSNLHAALVGIQQEFVGVDGLDLSRIVREVVIDLDHPSAIEWTGVVYLLFNKVGATPKRVQQFDYICRLLRCCGLDFLPAEELHGGTVPISECLLGFRIFPRCRREIEDFACGSDQRLGLSCSVESELAAWQVLAHQALECNCVRSLGNYPAQALCKDCGDKYESCNRFSILHVFSLAGIERKFSWNCKTPVKISTSRCRRRRTTSDRRRNCPATAIVASKFHKLTLEGLLTFRPDAKNRHF